jgi:hypothetical protein
VNFIRAALLLALAAVAIPGLKAQTTPNFIPVALDLSSHDPVMKSETQLHLPRAAQAGRCQGGEGSRESCQLRRSVFRRLNSRPSVPET